MLTLILIRKRKLKWQFHIAELIKFLFEHLNLFVKRINPYHFGTLLFESKRLMILE